MASRDYYADLELPPSADIQDIKKQFRKLALKYHPDRNPGREQEVNAQFQIIQSAHEVLSDPDAKARYDVSRTRSRYPTSSGVKGNPWSNVATNFPPPPRRNNQSARPPPPPPPSGAQRWQTRFSSGVPPTAKQAHGSEAKKNAAQAFENMRKSGQAREPRPQAPPPPPRSESARQKAQASFGSSSRKGGFQPRSGMMGDEPPVTSNNYTRRPDTERYAYGTPEPKQPPPPQPEPRQPAPPPRPVPDPLRQFRENGGTPFDSRQSTPYSAHIGERTNPFDGIPLGRAKSTRETNRRDDTSSDEDETASFRQRSASAPKTSDAGPSTPRRKPVPAQEPKIPEVPQDRPKAPLKKNRSFPASNKSQPNLHNSVPSHEPTTEAPQAAPQTAPQTVPQNSETAQDPNSTKPQSNGAGGPSIFNFPGNESGFPPMPPSPHQFARSSTDDINTSFVDDEDSTTWQFSAGGTEEAQPKSRSQSGSRTGRRSPLKRPPSQRPETPSAPSESGKSEGTFHAEGWSDKFGPQTFIPQPTPSQSASPTKSHRAGSRKPKPAKTAGGSAVVIDDSSDDELFEWRGRKTQAEPAVAESPQAMDIDSPPNSSPAAGVATGIPAPESPSLQTNAARNINVEPTRPEWRPGNTEAANGEPKPPPVPEKVKEFDANAVGSEDSEEFRATFADFKNVAPFAQQESGLKSFSDLRDTLPFDSKASADVPIKMPKPTPLAFPEVPTAPPLPQTVLIHGIHPNKQSWEKYVKEFEAYLRKWDTLNSQVVDHFSTRKTMIAKNRESKGYAFLEARDNTDIQEYCNWVQQDMEVRKRWSEACEEHQQRLREFMAFRQKMK